MRSPARRRPPGRPEHWSFRGYARGGPSRPPPKLVGGDLLPIRGRRKDGSVEAHRLQLVFPSIREGGVLGVGQHDRRSIGAEQSVELEARANGGSLREQTLRIFGAYGLDIGQRAAAQMGE